MVKLGCFTNIMIINYATSLTCDPCAQEPGRAGSLTPKQLADFKREKGWWAPLGNETIWNIDMENG